MSGVFGVWHLDARPIERSLVARLGALLAHRGADGEGYWADRSIALLFQNLWVTPESVGERQPAVRPGETVVLFDGRLDNRDDLSAELKQDWEVSRDSSDATLVSAVYRKFGERFAEKLNGDFAAVVYDIRERRLVLARDAIGMRPLYFAMAGKTFLVASEVKPILAHPAITPRPNGDMLAAALLACTGQEHQGWTFFDGISSVLPGQVVVVKQQAITKRMYWDFDAPAPVRLASFPEYVEAFRHHFQRAVARRTRSAFPVAVSVSGGVDSSSVYCTAERLQRLGSMQCPRVIGVSMEIDAKLADERAFLHDIEQSYETSIYRVPRVVRYSTDSLRKMFRDREVPYFRAPLDSAYVFGRMVRGLDARVQLSGDFSDQLLANRTYLIDLARRLKWASVWEHLVEHSKWNPALQIGKSTRWFLKDLARYHVPGPVWHCLRARGRRLVSRHSWYADGFWERARRVEELQRFRSRGVTAYQNSIYQSVRPMYYVQALEWCNKIAAVNGFDCALPFLDRDLVSFLLAIPAGVVCSAGVPKAILRKAMRGVLPPSIAGRRWKAEISQELRSAMDHQFSEYSRYLDGDVMSVALGYVDERRLRARLPILKRQLSEGALQATVQLGDLFGLELWLQSFFGTKLNSGQETMGHAEETGRPLSERRAASRRRIAEKSVPETEALDLRRLAALDHAQHGPQ